jgi:tRNA G18 (ribose-2'-O)-methylase SpoU
VLFRSLQQDGVKVYAVEQTEKAIMLNDFSVLKNSVYALVFGNEVKGVQQEVVDLADGAIEVPQFGTKHSLNISVCTGICVWDFYTKIAQT